MEGVPAPRPELGLNIWLSALTDEIGIVPGGNGLHLDGKQPVADIIRAPGARRFKSNRNIAARQASGDEPAVIPIGTLGQHFLL